MTTTFWLNPTYTHLPDDYGYSPVTRSLVGLRVNMRYGFEDTVREFYDNMLCHFERSEKSFVTLAKRNGNRKTGYPDGFFRPNPG
jgi:hypothetical protein